MQYDIETTNLDHEASMLSRKAMDVKSGANMLSTLVITYIMAKTPSFYRQICEEVQIETTRSCKDIIRGTVTSKIVSERVMSKIFAQIPKEVYDIAATSEVTDEDRTITNDLVMYAIKRTVERDVDQFIAKIAKELA